MKQKRLFEYWPNFTQKSRVVTLLFIKLPFFKKKFDGFSQYFHGICHIDAKEGNESLLVIAHAIHELSQKSGS